MNALKRWIWIAEVMLSEIDKYDIKLLQFLREDINGDSDLTIELKVSLLALFDSIISIKTEHEKISQNPNPNSDTIIVNS